MPQRAQGRVWRVQLDPEMLTQGVEIFRTVGERFGMFRIGGFDSQRAIEQRNAAIRARQRGNPGTGTRMRRREVIAEAMSAGTTCPRSKL